MVPFRTFLWYSLAVQQESTKRTFASPHPKFNNAGERHTIPATKLLYHLKNFNSKIIMEIKNTPMLTLKIISVGTLKEPYLRDAVAEYEKRLTAFCSPELIQIKESRLPADPSDTEIAAAVAEEGKRILAQIPPRAYVAALAIEGRQFSSEELAAKIDEISSLSGTLCFIIGGSYGLSDEVKNAAALKLSFSKLTFPHQLMRVILYEALYRSFNILKGTKYHK